MTTDSCSLLDVLSSRSKVACDTLSDETAKKLTSQAFVDCTSNQAIAHYELTREDPVTGKPVHAQLIQDAVAYAHVQAQNIGDDEAAEVAVEAMQVKLALRIVPYIKGFSHIQTNPKLSYDKDGTIQCARRIVQIFKDLDPSYDARRVCIKIPATWEGLQACRVLEVEGISTLATTLFCMEQAVLADHVGCTYIAPYVNELRVHFDPGYMDENKALAFCGQVQRHFNQIKSKTQVLPASFTSIDELMKLAGAHHITVSPTLLAELSATPSEQWQGETGTVFTENEAPTEAKELALYKAIIEDEAKWRMAFTRSSEGKMEGKLTQAINIFCEKQDRLEEMAWKVISTYDSD